MNEGSFVDAAKILYISPQAVSKAISELEKELHLELFVKSGRGIIPTSNGSLLASKAYEIVQNCSDLKSYANSLHPKDADPSTIHGSINLAAVSSPYEGEVIPKSFFEKLQRKYPGVTFSLSHGSSGSCLSTLLEDIVDCSIILGRYKNPEYRCVKVFDSALELGICKSHPLAKKKSISLSSIKKYPVAKPRDLRHCRPLIEKHLRKRKCESELVELSPTLEDYQEFLHEQNGAVFVAPDPDLKKLYSNIRILPLHQDDQIKIPVCCVYRPEKENKIISLLQRALVSEAKNNHFTTAQATR